MTYQDKLDQIAPGVYQYEGKEDSRPTRSVLKDLRYGVTFTYVTGSFLLNLRKDPLRVFWNPTRGNVISVPEGEDAFRLEAQLRLDKVEDHDLKVLSFSPETGSAVLLDRATGMEEIRENFKMYVANLKRGTSSPTITDPRKSAQQRIDTLSSRRIEVVGVELSPASKKKKATYVTILDKETGNTFRHRLSYICKLLHSDPGHEFGRKKEEIQEDREATNLRKYGVRCPLQSKEIKIKQVETLKDRYGVENCSQLPNHKEKYESTSKKRYGTSHPMQNTEVRQRAIEGSKERHGGVHHAADPEVRAKIMKTSIERYGHKTPLDSPAIRSKIKNSMLLRYGVDNPQKNPTVRAKTRHTRIVNGTTRLYDGKTIPEIAGDIGSSIGFVRRLISRMSYDKAKPILYSYTPGGSSLTTAVVSLFPKFSPVIDKKLLGTKIRPDLLFPDQKVIVEADGLYWHSEASANGHWNPDKNYHRNKLRAYEGMGYRALFFRSNEIWDNPAVVKSIVENALRVNSTRIFARKCDSIRITPAIFKACHLMGAGSGRCYGLSYENQIVAGIQVKWVSKKDRILDISRFVTDSGVTVVGGWSKLIALVGKQEQPNTIQTFIDRRYGTGGHLARLGWKKRSEHPSFKWTDGIKTWGRMSFPGNSGLDHGLARVWDCGQAKWELSL